MPRKTSKTDTESDASGSVVGITLGDGTLYSGNAVNGIPEGMGVIKFIGASYFKGRFHEGAPDGHGYVKLNTGETIEGTFSANVFTGEKRMGRRAVEVRYTVRNGRLIKMDAPRKPVPPPEPEFVPEEPEPEVEETYVPEELILPVSKPKNRFRPATPEPVCTHGVKEYPDGTYEGDLRNNKREGRGRFTRKDGTVIEGEFYNDAPHGRCTMVNPQEGMVFEGLFRNGEFHKGKLTFGNRTYIGEFKRNLFHGVGKFIGSDGRELEGVFHYGQYIGPIKDPSKAATWKNTVNPKKQD